MIFDNLVDPPCLCLQEVISEVQRDESKIMHTLAGSLLPSADARKALPRWATMQCFRKQHLTHRELLRLLCMRP